MKKLLNPYRGHPTKCPFCRGTGIARLNWKFHNIPIEKKKKCLELRKQGLSFRQIAKEVGFEHAQSVVSAIKTYIKTK